MKRTVLFVFVRCAARRKNIFAMVLFVIFSRRGAACFYCCCFSFVALLFLCCLGSFVVRFRGSLVLFCVLSVRTVRTFVFMYPITEHSSQKRHHGVNFTRLDDVSNFSIDRRTYVH